MNKTALKKALIDASIVTGSLVLFGVVLYYALDYFIRTQNGLGFVVLAILVMFGLYTAIFYDDFSPKEEE